MLPSNIQAIEPTICEEPGCEKQAVTYGFCKKHYNQNFKRMITSNKELLERIYQRVIIDKNNCHIFPKLTSAGRRPNIGFKGIKKNVHVAVYEACKGQIPIKHHLHHTCGEIRCVNPDHMEILTHSEHSRRHYNKKKICPITGRFLKQN